MKNLLETVIAESGIWDGTQNETHRFLLSPSVYKITESQRSNLQMLGHAINECMLGLSQLGILAYDKQANYNNGAWSLVRRVFSTGIPKTYHPFQGQNLRNIPKLLKVDLMIDQSGAFKIAEIDGHNKHGLGYSTLGLMFRKKLYPESNSLPGVICTLSNEITKQGYEEIKIFYADQEKFYLPEFKIAQKEFLKYGITCTILSESEAMPNDLKSGLLLDIPFLYHNVALYKGLLEAYEQKKVTCIIPPKPFLGSKGVLALIRNDMGDKHLESLLNAFIPKLSLEKVRGHIPETYLVGKNIINNQQKDRRYVLKECISSGMKGVFFSDEDDFKNALQIANSSKLNWVMQEEVRNQPQTFEWYESNTNNKSKLQNTQSQEKAQKASDWLMRITVHYVKRTLADITVTARRDRSVHGAKDCLQLGTIIE